MAKHGVAVGAFHVIGKSTARDPRDSCFAAATKVGQVCVQASLDPAATGLNARAVLLEVNGTLLGNRLGLQHRGLARWCKWPDIGNTDATTISTAIMAQAAPMAKRAFFVRLFRSNVNSCPGEHRIVCRMGWRHNADKLTVKSNG